MKMIYAFILIFNLVACSEEKNNSAPAKFDEAKLREISSVYCTAGKKLVELNLDANTVEFEYLNVGVPIVAFVNGDDRCALTSDINDSWGIGWFTVNIRSDCLPNGSFWKITSGLNSNDVRDYTLESIDPQDLPDIHLGGPRDMNTKYARDHAGLRALECK